jgi:hypothetical protein
VAGGSLAGVAVALLTAGSENIAAQLEKLNAESGLEKALSPELYQLLGVVFFIIMAMMLYRIAMKKEKIVITE